ncbi:MAG: hypothetical protein Q8Q03_01930, partial [bacterium]|nr:hypothetical protein [bacterium]
NAGKFTIEKIQPSDSPQYNDSLLTKEDVLKEVEEVGKKAGVSEGVSFVDHLLSNPVSVPQQTEVIKEMPAEEKHEPEVKKEEAPKNYQVDPYREQI